MLTIIFLVFLGAVLVGFDVGLSMVAAAIVGMILHPTYPVDLIMVPLTMSNAVNDSTLVTIPLFVLAAEIMNHGGLTRRLVDWALSVVGHVKGGLSQVSITSNLIMAGVSGSAVADAAATGGILIPAMRKEGYPEGYAGAVVASGAMLGPIIPPSVPMIIYAVIANVSVVKLFMAGIVPGVMLAVGYMVICWLIARSRDYPSRPRQGLRAIIATTQYSLFALGMPVIIVLGMRFGYVTDIEASALAALYALLVSVFVYRAIGLRQLLRVIFLATRSAAAVLFLLAAAGPFGWLLAEAKINDAIASGILSITSDPLVGLLLINLILLAIGCFLEPLPALVIFIPSLLPVGAALGIDPVHLGLVMVMNLMIGMLTPPVGLLLFVVAGIGQIPLVKIIRAVLPFLVWSLVVLGIATVFPAVVLWLPGQV
ncbi:TRAP transporter large permease [Acuticoccus sediminis]|uniref:TRAP transporter large permease n=1 Tax=Acuticoccus sediminis TaxID=2184697 RepID=UPI001391B823|nr:TRAP transporter large permease [Acuticoccus sediminis]